MATAVTLIDVLQPTPCAVTLYEYLHIYDRSMFAASSTVALRQFCCFLNSLPKDQQLSAKSFALRHWILRPNNSFYPMAYLQELKKIGSRLHPSASPEFVGKLRKAFYDDDLLLIKILIDFGVDASKIMNDVLRKNLFCQTSVLDIVFSSEFIDLNYPYYRNKIPIVLAAIFLDKYEIWQVLASETYSAKVDWTVCDKKGRNLAYWSVCSRTKNILPFLKCCHEKNIDLDKKDINGNRPVTIAVCHKKPDVLKYLVEECKIDINQQNESGNTIAHDMCERSVTEMLSYLIPKGLRVDIKNNNGESALDYARMYYSQEIIDILIANNVWDH